MSNITFTPGRWYVMDRLESTADRAYVSGPFASQQEAETDRLERNIGDSCDSWQCPDSPPTSTQVHSLTHEVADVPQTPITSLEVGLQAVLQAVRETGRSAHPRADQRVSDLVMAVSISLGLNPVELQSKVSD